MPVQDRLRAINGRVGGNLVDVNLLVLVALAVGLAIGRAGLAEDTRRAAAAKPNVIVLIVDDQGYGDLSCHGNPVLRTPHLDRLHAESVRFTDFHAAPVCTPTRGQLLTGVDALRNGAWSWAFGQEMIRRDLPTMADIFRANGYRTGHFGKWHLGDNYPYRPQDKGFDESVTLGGAATHQTPDYWQNDNLDDHYRHTDGQWRQHKGYCTDVWFDLTMDFMRRCRDEGRPFFCYLPTNAPHSPYYVTLKDAARYAGVGKGNEGAFFGMIANLDDNVGRLAAFLGESGLGDDTIVIYLTDNGGTQGIDIYNAGMRGRKGTYYDGGHRIPCFVRWPRGQLGQPRDVDELAQVQDILPTLVDLCGLNVEPSVAKGFDGTSLAALLRGTATALPDRKLVVQWSPQESPVIDDAAVLWKKWRLVHGKELYDVAADPGQARDVAADHADIVATLRSHYDTWWREVSAATAMRQRIVIGGAENPARLTLFDWRKRTTADNVTNQPVVWNGRPVNGEWTLEAATPGLYRFQLRRYPVEARAGLSAAVPAVTRELHEFPPCRPLPVAQARLSIRLVAGGAESGPVEQEVVRTATVGADDEFAALDVQLPHGPLDMKASLLDAEGHELCGAYYVDVERVAAR
jgi:arylsulfatase A-like enzyme